MRTTLLTTAGLAVLCALGCDDAAQTDEVVPDLEEAEQAPKAPPEDDARADARTCPRERFEDELGRRWVLRQPAPVERARELRPGEKPPWEKPETESRLASMEADELAEMMRAVTIVDDCEYIEERANRAAAEWVIANRATVFDFPGSTGSMPAEEVPEGAAAQAAASPSIVIGSDQREKRNDNTSFPMRTQILLTGSGACSATMIGELTAISAAHCFHDSNNWLPDKSWAPGADSQDAVRFPYNPAPGAAYPLTNPNNPATFQCYLVTVPGGWLSSDGDRDWDYAVIEFNNPSCPLKPGGTVGWLGWGTQSDDTIEDNQHWVYGYPGNFNGSTNCGKFDGCFGPTAGPNFSCFWPKIWGWGMGGLSAWSTTLSYDIDTSGGQSGSGVYNKAQGFRKVVGIHVGCQENLFGDYNQARRIDSSVVSFIKSHSKL